LNSINTFGIPDLRQNSNMSLLELVTLGLADSKSPWSFFLHGSKLHDPRLLLQIVAFKGFGMSEWVDLVIAERACPLVKDDVYEEALALNPWGIDEMSVAMAQATLSNRSIVMRGFVSQFDEFKKELGSKKRGLRGRFRRGKFNQNELFEILWLLIEEQALMACLLFCLRRHPRCHRTVSHLMYILWKISFQHPVSPFKACGPESTDPVYLCMFTDIQKQWKVQRRRLNHYLNLLKKNM